MHAIETTPTHEQVRAALLWALDNDRDALLAHRESTQQRPWESARIEANRRLVEWWLECTTRRPPHG